MNTTLIGHLVSLRYKLLWAKTRSRNGRIAIFLAGYLLLILVIALLASGGFGAAIVAIRSGKGEQVAQAVLGGVFIEAVFASNILGFGLNAIFNDLELRRYPLAAADRRIARHLTGIVDPFWMLFFALDVGLALGLYGAGAGSFWFGMVAVLLLFVCNYLLARVVGTWIEGLMQRKGGGAILLGLVMLLAILPSLMPIVFKGHPERLAPILAALRYTPPFGAAAAMIHPGMEAVSGLLLIVVWMLGLAAMLVRLENRPPQRTAAATVKIDWDTPYERAAALFGPRAAPLVALWLRFYLRNTRTRAIGLMAIPLIGFLTFQIGNQMHAGFFLAAMGTFPAATFLGVARFSVNQFGYTGGGFRRYFLLPADPGAALRTGSFASLLLGSTPIPILLAAWLVLSPERGDLAKLVMLAASAVTGLFLFQAAGMWVSLFNPRKGNYAAALGNDLSLGGNILLIGGMMTSLFAPRVISKVAPALVDPTNWWMVVAIAAAAIVLYTASLNAGCRLLAPRRERLLAIVEGRD